MGTNKFEITWERAYAPLGFSVEAYNISVADQDGQILQQGSVNATSERLRYSYTSKRSRSEHPECSRLVFTVIAIANGKSSQGVSVSWSGAGKGEVCLTLGNSYHVRKY